jgi:hypothetical protein
MTADNAQSMQTTSHFDDGVRATRFGIAQDVFDNTTAFHASNHMFDLNVQRRENLIRKFVFSGEFILFGLLLRLASDANPCAIWGVNRRH